MNNRSLAAIEEDTDGEMYHDAMLALRSIYRSTGAWDQFWASRRVA